MVSWRLPFAAMVMVGLSASAARAIPILQLYVEGGTYDDTTETWVTTPEGSSAGEPFRIWAIGNVDGPGGKGTISDVRLSIAYDIAYEGLDITLTPTRVGGDGSYSGINDPSKSGDAMLNTTVQTSEGEVTTGPDGEVTNGGTPVLGDGKNLPPHGIFGPDTVWREYSLGDFTLTDSPTGDFIDDFPDELHSGGQINAYDVSVIGGSGATVHFDLYNTVPAGNHSLAEFAPFSHDADGEANVIPELPSRAVWLIFCLAGVAVVARRRWRG